MSLLEKILRIGGPTLLCGFVGILVMTRGSDPPKVHRVTDDFVGWVSNTIGPVPTGFLFIMMGIAWSMSAYYRISGRR